MPLAALLEDRKSLVDERVGISSLHFGDNSASFKRQISIIKGKIDVL